MLERIRSINWTFVVVIGFAWTLFALVLNAAGPREILAFIIAHSAGVYWMSIREQTK